jgi:hypothetical protein
MHMNLRHLHPPSLLSRRALIICFILQARWGPEATQDLLRWNNEPPHTYARVNSLRGSCEELLAQWEAEGTVFSEATHVWAPASVRIFQIKPPRALMLLPSFLDGLFYVQVPLNPNVWMVAFLHLNCLQRLCAYPFFFRRMLGSIDPARRQYASALSRRNGPGPLRCAWRQGNTRSTGTTRIPEFVSVQRVYQ